MGRYIPDQVLDEIRLRSDIVEVIQSYLPLKRSGGRLKALCPFHQEKTPSFIVSPERQTFHCFGCGHGGDVFRFVMERENVDFPTSVELLAMRCGVEIPEDPERRGGGQATEPEAEATAVKRPRLFQLHDELATWYAERLTGNPAGEIAQYAAGRGLDGAVLAKFRLGAAPDSWDETLNRCLRQGYTREELLVAGIVLEHEERKSLYDRFRHRLMFPIWDEQGRVAAFSARTIGAAEGAKYVNSPETPIFRKGRVLYALPLAREGFRRHSNAILCEGQLDVIAMHRAGFDNAVAPQGTAFTAEQAQVLHRYTDRVLLAFDGDEAGTKAMARTLEILLPQDFEVRVIVLPAGSDPDGLFAAGGREAIVGLVAGAEDFFEVICAQAERGDDAASPWGRRRVADAVLPLVALIGNGITRAGYCTRLAQRLDMPEDAVFTELNRRRATRRRTDPVTLNGERQEGGCSEVADTVLTPSQRALAILLELALTAGVYGQRLAKELPAEWRDDNPLWRALDRVIAMTLDGAWEEAAKRLAAGLAQEPDPVISALLADPQFAVTPGDSVDSRDEIREKACADALATLAHEHCQMEIDQLSAGLRRGEGDAATALQRLAELKRRQLDLKSTTRPVTAAPTPRNPEAASPVPPGLEDDGAGLDTVAATAGDDEAYHGEF